MLLDYELKRNLNRDLALLGPEKDDPDRKMEVAEKHQLQVVNGKIPVPDLRVEYETPELELRHVDLELATRDYRPRAMAEKAAAGFSFYGAFGRCNRAYAAFLTNAKLPQESSRYEHCRRPISTALKALGYTEAEARFLYIVATHSGYFVARQFLAFTAPIGASGRPSFWSKLQTKRHARTECFPKSGTVYHLFSRRLYRQIDRENIRNRREHEIEHIQRRIAMLDFVLRIPRIGTTSRPSPKRLAFFLID